MNMMIREAAAASEKMTDAPRFVHLRVHSAYSLLEGALPIGKLAKLAVANKAPAIGLTDRNNLFGALEFSNKLSAEGVQSITGLTLAVDFDDASDSGPVGHLGATRMVDHPSIALLAMSEAGYANLMKLSSQGFFDPAENEPAHVGVQRLEAHSDGLIAMTGGPDGPVNAMLAEGNSDKARQRLTRLHEIFGDRLYVELQRHNVAGEQDVESGLLELAYEAGVPLVATNQCYFATADDYEAHDALLCIADGRYVVEDDRRRLTPEHGLKSEADMVALFADLPEAINNTIEIARRCHYRPLGRPPILPQFVSAGEGASAEEQLAVEAAETDTAGP